MRKTGGFIMNILLLLLVPALANAWTLTSKVEGPSSAGTVLVEVGGITVQEQSGGTVTLPVANDQSATITVIPNGDYTAADIYLNYAVEATQVTDSYVFTIHAGTTDQYLQVRFGTASASIGSVEVEQARGGSIVLQNGFSSSMTGFTNLTYGTTVGVSAMPRTDYKVTSIEISDGIGSTPTSFNTAVAGQTQTAPLTVTAAEMSVTATYVQVPKVNVVLAAPINAAAGNEMTVKAAGTTSNMPITDYNYLVNGATVCSGPNVLFCTITPTANPNFEVKLAVTVQTAGGPQVFEKSAFTNVLAVGDIYNKVCLGCHTGSTPQIIADFNTGIHGGPGYACVTCHTSTPHTVTPDFAVSDCSGCHAEKTPDVVDAYLDGDLATTSCTDCHTAAPHTADPYMHKIVENSAGHDVAAGSDVCLVCHTAQAAWASTPHTQKAKKGKEYVIGYGEGPDGSHTRAAAWITANRETYVHPKNIDASGTVIDSTKLGVRAVMTEKPTVTYSDRTFGVDDIAFIIGSNYKQAYAVWMQGHGYKVLNIRYNNIGLSNEGMGDRTDERVWEGSCIGCHATTSAATANLPFGYADSATPFDLNPYLSDLRVGCEACHRPVTETGTGALLHNMVDGIGHAINPADLTQDQQIDSCGRCHGNWDTTVPGTSARKDVPEFKAGDSLVYLLSPEYNGGVDRLRRPSWNADDVNTKPFLGNGASNDDHQQWYDFKIGGHYGVFYDGKPVTCTSCHDPHQSDNSRRYGRKILKGDYDFVAGTSTVCATCHEGASFVDTDGKTVTKKNTDGALNPHTAKPYGEGVPEAEWREDGKWPWE